MTQNEDNREKESSTLLGNRKVRYGTVAVVGLIVGIFIGTTVGGFALGGVIGPPQNEEPECDQSDCVVLDNGAGFNVKLHFYDGDERVHETSSLAGGGTIYEIESPDISDADRIEVEAHAVGPCGGVYESFEDLEPGDHPVEISTSGSICVGKGASIDKS